MRCSLNLPNAAQLSRHLVVLTMGFCLTFAIGDHLDELKLYRTSTSL